MNPFGDAIRLLMERRGIAGKQLAADIGISPTSVSKIVTGQSKPRQVTLARIMKRLCTTAEEEQMVVRAFTGLLDGIPDAPEKPERPIPDDEIERVTRYLEIKSMSVAFKKDVEAMLQGFNLKYQPDFRADPFICDFLVTIGSDRVAIDCKYNVNRDWDRTYATVKLLRENLPCDQVIVAIPYENELAKKARRDISREGSKVLDIAGLNAFLKRRKTL